MPFKFRLKKVRRYNVSSKHSYVVCVHLLDNTLIECTLTSENTGRECLENIAQRIELSQLESFGLRYVNRRLEQRWIELDKPLRRQLDKYAHSPLLYLGIMCYAVDAQNIVDEMTRYQYYLQLKVDVIDGKLTCTPAQAVLLASYSVQAEFGDHNQGQHTSEYLKDFMLLPRNITSDDQTLSTLIQEIVSTHRSLVGMSAAVAELQYIILAQQLEGYGLEYYPAKDEFGNDILLGASFIGIFVKHLNGQPTVYFKWTDISNLTHNRKTFSLETSLNEHAIHFQTDDPDMAKYIFKMCTLQHKFYRTSHLHPDSSAHSEASIEATTPVPEIQISTQPPVTDVPDGMTPNIQVEEIATTIHTPYQTTVTAEPVLTSAAIQADPVTSITSRPAVAADLSSVYVQSPGIASPVIPVSSRSSSTSLLLPAYRDSPSYDAVMQRRMTNLVYASALACSQPEIRASRTPPSYAQYINQRAVDRTCSLIIYPTFSTPADQTLLEPHPVPPAYPRTTSTPDLARGSIAPELINQSQFDQSLDNLALDTHRLLLGQRAAADAKCLTDGDDVSVRRTPSPDREFLITDPPNMNTGDCSYVVVRRNSAYSVSTPGGDAGSLSYSERDVLTPDLSLVSQQDTSQQMNGGVVGMGPLKMAALNGLSQSSGSVLDYPDDHTQTPEDERLRTLEVRLLSGQVFAEFERIPKRRTHWSCDIAEHEQNVVRNRFRDVLPYDDNRVCIEPTPSNPTGYINASHVQMVIGSEQWHYLVAQAPLADTVTDFWQMIWSQRVHVIAMLTAVNEGGKEKCMQYWPQQPGMRNKVCFGKFQVWLQFSSPSGAYTTSGLSLRCGSGGEERLIWHLQYTGWPDHGHPEDATEFLMYLDEIESVRRHVALEQGSDPQSVPTLVHCTAGVGRSGVVILSEIVKACLARNQDIDVPGVLQMMRDQRMHLVQTISQYRFVYKVLIQYLSKSRLI